MQDKIYSLIESRSGQKRKQIAVLIDPDKVQCTSLQQLADNCEQHGVDYIFVGGSLIRGSFWDECIVQLKSSTQIPVVLFPGNTLQIHPHADAILLLSLISGRNPELLIGSHVVAAPLLKRSGLEVIPVGYMLIDGGKPTSVVYMSHTTPIPGDKTDIAVCTALAGQMLGLKMIYLDAGSGANTPVSQEMIGQVRKNTQIPLIIGGGITHPEVARKAWQAGADIIVVGNVLEKSPGLLQHICLEKELLNRQIAGLS